MIRPRWEKKRGKRYKKQGRKTRSRRERVGMWVWG